MLFDPDRFVRAQDAVFERVRRELRDGRKRGHWMWYVFPQLSGLGYSTMAQRYAIASLGEAAAYLEKKEKKKKTKKQNKNISA